jgi:predicted RNase H-like HicB family nuclease
MDAIQTLIDFPGVYGGAASRDEVLRQLKEALALVENTARDAELSCAGLRIDVLDPGTAES